MDFYKIIYKELSKLDHKYQNTSEINPKVFISDVQKQLNRITLPTKIICKRYKGYCKNGVVDGTVSGLYVAELDDENMPCVFLCFGVPFNKHIYNKNWSLTKETISTIVEHELVHLRQHRMREFDDDCISYVDEDEEDMDYWSHEDELEAHGLQCARELFYSCKTYKNCLQAIDKICYSKLLILHTKKFDKYPKVKKIFLKWVKEYLWKIEKGLL